MSDKTRQEFEAWAKKNRASFFTPTSSKPNQFAFSAWQHQQAVIDALRVENADLEARLMTMLPAEKIDANDIAWAEEKLKGIKP